MSRKTAAIWAILVLIALGVGGGVSSSRWNPPRQTPAHKPMQSA